MHTELFLLKGWELADNHFMKNNRKSTPKLIASIFVCHTSHIFCLGRQNYSGGDTSFTFLTSVEENRWMVLKSDTSLVSNKKVSCPFIFTVSKWLSQCNARWTVQHIKSGQQSISIYLASRTKMGSNTTNLPGLAWWGQTSHALLLGYGVSGMKKQDHLQMII